MDIANITAGLTALGTTAKSLGTILETVKDAKARQAIIEIQARLLDVQGKFLEFQSGYDELSKENRELAAKQDDRKAWNEIKDHHQLIELSPGIVVYIANPAGHPQYYLCPNCFWKKEVSFLQRIHPGTKNLNCHRCGMELALEKPPPAFGAVVA